MGILDRLIHDLQKKIIEGSNLHQFLESIDQFCRISLPTLISTGLSKTYSEALLLKIANFLVGKYQYKNYHEYLISSPYALIIDPANGCPLHCPGCLHNATFQNKIGPDWPNGLLAKDTYTYFIEKFGPYASTILFFNWGEPLLNKFTPTFIRQAKQFLLHTSLSSNLSVRFDAEDLVNSGLDYMVLSIDGATPQTYRQYRQGGNFNLVIENVRKLVSAKKKSGKTTPWLCWHFLLFEHNKHEVQLAKTMANDLGVDAIKFSLPYDVIWQRNIQIAQNVKENKYTFNDNARANTTDEPNISKLFSTIFRQKWSDKLNNVEKGLYDKRSGNTCQWLYSTIVMDALGRYFPCCYVPRRKAGFTYIFSKQDLQNDDYLTSPFNSEYYRFSRKHFAWISELKKQKGFAPILEHQKHATYCVACPNKKIKPLISDFDLKYFLKKIDRTRIMSNELIDIISGWSL